MAKDSEEERERKAYYWRLVRSGIYFGWPVLGGYMYLVYQNKLDFLAGKTTVDDIKTYGDGVKLVLKMQTLNLVWTLYSIYCVMAKRRKTPAVDPLAGKDKFVEAEQRHFVNTFEHFVLFLVSQLVMVSLDFSPRFLLRVIPSTSFMFLLGRILFYFGYPRRRTPGMMVSFSPIAAINFLNVYTFVKSYFA